MAAALAAGSVRAQTILTNGYTNTFPNGGATSDFTGGSVASWLYWYGLSYGNTAMSGDPTNDAAGDATSGSLYLNLPFSGSSQQVQMFGTFDNQYGYDSQAQIPVNIITNMGFDVYVATNTPLSPNGDYGVVQMSLVDPGWSNGGRVVPFSNLTIPGAAGGHWVHLQDTNVVAECLAMSEANYNFAAGVGFYINSYNGTYPLAPMNLWIDNVFVQTSAAPPPPPPPPTLASPVKAVSGLNIFNSTEGNGFFDRQEVELVNSHGLGWVGKTGSGPISYSFTIKSFPNGGDFSGESYLFLVPNPVAQEGAPDYNETNCAIFFVQRNGNGGQGVFQYKVNENQGNNMTYDNVPSGYTNAPGSWDGVSTLTSNGTNVWKEKGTLTNVQSTVLLGTWTLTFTSDTQGKMIAPDGTVANFTIPSYYINNFQESSGFNVYFGNQANAAGYLDLPVVYSGFSISGTGASDMSETFDGETTLNTNVWNNSYSTGPAGTLIVPTNAAYWVSWSLPANSFALQNTASVGPGASWQSVNTYNIIPMKGTNTQLVASADLRSPIQDFFRVIKRSFSQMLVLLPGETFTPGVSPGYSGSPTALSMGGNPVVQELVTVQAVDSQFNAIPGISDTVNIILGPGSDSGEVPPASTQAMVNGSTTFGNSNPFFFGDQGTWTVTVTNLSNTNIPNATSASVVVGP